MSNAELASSKMVFFLKTKPSWGRYPILVSLAKTRSPSPGSVKRQISLKSVDLPVPLGPIKPILSFLRMCRETLSKIALLPNARLTLFRRIIHESLIQRAMKIYHPPLLPPIEGGKVPSPLVGEGWGEGEFFWMNHFTPPYTASRYSFQKHSAVRNPASVRI